MSSTEVVERSHVSTLADLNGRAWLELLEPVAALANKIAGTPFVPKSVRNDAAAIAAAILYGDELGLGPMQSLSKIVVIDGRPTLTAEAQRALVLAAGHEIWVEESTNTRVTVCGRRAGQERVVESTWTADDAKRAGLSGKPSYRAYPRQMLTARASADLARTLFADVIGGLAAAEEFEGELEPDAKSSSASSTESKTRRRRTTTSKPESTGSVAAEPETQRETPSLPGETSESQGSDEPAESPSEPPPLPGEEALEDAAQTSLETPAAMSDDQRKKMQALFRELDVSQRDARLAYCAQIAEREIESSLDLTLEEASRVIDALEKWKSNPAGGPFQDGIPY